MRELAVYLGTLRSGRASTRPGQEQVRGLAGIGSPAPRQCSHTTGPSKPTAELGYRSALTLGQLWGRDLREFSEAWEPCPTLHGHFLRDGGDKIVTGCVASAQGWCDTWVVWDL